MSLQKLDVFQSHIAPACPTWTDEVLLCEGFVAWASAKEMRVDRVAWARARG